MPNPDVSRSGVWAQTGPTVQDASRRYLTDLPFHILVDRAVATMQHEHGVRFDGHDLSLATEAAAIVLLMKERV